MMQYFHNLQLVENYLPRFLGILAQKNAADYSKTLPSANRTDFGTVSVILFESEKEFSKPERLIEILQATTDLYTGLAKLLGESPDSLSVLSCDSGSDKSFDFLGLADVMKEFKEVVISLWDRVVFYKEKRLASQLDVIASSLPVLAKVTELESTGKLGPEESEIIRRVIIGGATKFLQAGAIIPEVHAHATHEPRALMTPEKKLLMPPPPQADPNTIPSPAIQINSILPEDNMADVLARLRRLEQERTNTSSDAPPASSPERSEGEGKETDIF